MRRLADVSRAGSFSNHRRARRFERFERLLAGVERPIRLLDVGGTNSFWEQRSYAGREDVHIVAANIEPESRRHANIEPVVMDATMLDFPDGSFDVVFSNSVIQHLETHVAQVAMASEIRRLAPRYWVQTPNRRFPMEPHFLTPGWQYLPEGMRVELLRRRDWGWRERCPDPDRARAMVREIRMLRRREMRELFPEAELIQERFGPLVKSFVAARF